MQFLSYPKNYTILQKFHYKNIRWIIIDKLIIINTLIEKIIRAIRKIWYKPIK